MTTIMICQPAYLPWLGFFDRVLKSDILVILDHVTMDRNTKTRFTNRNKIKTPNGPLWLSIPTFSRGKNSDLPIFQIKTAAEVNWQKKHIESITANYKKTKYFDKYSPKIFEIIKEDRNLLIDYINPLTELILDYLSIKKQIFYSHQLDLKSKKSDLIEEICLKFSADRYISGPFGRNYLNLDNFRANSIDVRFHDYEHPVYNQSGGKFLPFMSVVDLLFNEGASALSILESRGNLPAS